MRRIDFKETFSKILIVASQFYSKILHFAATATLKEFFVLSSNRNNTSVQHELNWS